MSTAFISLLAYCANAQVSGTVFKDFNMDGTKGTASPNLEVGMAGVVVKATKPDGTALTVTYTGGGTSTNTTGAYTVTGGTAGQIRLEFVMPDSYTFASKGAAGGTTVMFPSGTTQNLAVNYPADYCGVTDPMLVTSCYVGNNAAGMNDVLVKYAYSSSGPSHSASHTTIGVKSEMGSVWGIAYDRQKQDLFVGAFVKRHIALKDNNSDGKEDIGAIYIVPSSGSPSLWLDVTTLGVDVGMSLMPTIATRALPVPVTTSDLAASHDTQLYSLVGKIGLGDIEISDDNTQLFFVNLYDSKIYTVDIATKALVGSGIAVPNSCTEGNARPFALTYHRGKLYIGSVCDAATSKVDADMKATVYRLDGTTFTSVLSFPLNYTKGAAFTWGGVYGNKWNPWEDSFSNISGGISPTGLNLVCEPQPIFADIVFDTDESLIMVFNDRLGHQTGTANYQPSTSDTKLYYGLAGGDILRASLVSGVYTLEKNATSGGVTTAGAGNGQGPGTPTGTGYTSPSGEFYVGDDENSVHEEVVGGGAAIVPGRGQVVTQVSDPDQNYFAGGTYWFNNTTGEYDKSYVVFIDPSFGLQPWLFGKANGLGDMEVMCNNAPIEIGNRVWDDTDKDGIQDAGEAGIQNVSVTLCDKNGTPISGATATTDANGNYFFSSATGTNSTSAKYGLNLTFNTDYILKFPTASGTKSLTGANLGGNDLVDSDATTDGKIAFTTGYAGENNHSFDVGYSTCTPPAATASATQPSCSGTNTPNNGGITIAGFSAGQRYQYSAGATFNSGSAIPSSITAIPSGGVITGTLSNTTGNYTVRIYDATDDACYIDRTISITAVICGSSGCCTTEIYAQPGLESSEVMNDKFPNATITTTNNSASFADHVITGGWNFDDGAASGKSMYRIRDASRASEGSEFIYLPFINGINTYNYCIQPKPKITYSSAASCATAQMVIGRRYVLAYDYVPFNQDVPAGGTGQQKPVADMFNAGGSQIGSYTAYNASGTAIPYETAVSWADIKTSWKRAYFSVVIPSGSDSFYASAMKDGSAGMLIDNLSLKELTLTTGGIGTVSCDATQTKRVFTLNPTSNAGGVPNLKYNVTAPSGYTISPTQGTYGQAITFTLTKTSGSAIGTGSLSITLTDEVNTYCSITETVADVVCTVACTPPTATATATQPSCSGTNAPNNGGITIASFTAGQRYQYSAGATFNSGSAIPSSITAIPSGGVITGTLSNTSGDYTIRIYDATDGACYVDRKVTITAVTCPTVNCNCPDNLITNPSFETGDFTGWTLATNDPGQTSFAGDNTYAVCGTKYAYFNPTSGNSSDTVAYYQELSTVAGTVFNLSIYSGVHDPTQDHQIRLQFFNASHALLSGGQSVQVDNDVDIAGATSLIQYTLSGTAPAGTAYVRVSAFVKGAYADQSIAIKIDNVCLTKTDPVCVKPTLGATVTTAAGTCTNSTPNNNATASLTVTGGDKADIVEGATYGTGPAYGAGTNVSVSAGSVSFSNLKHNTQYTIRVWNADNICYEDKTFTTATITCSCTNPVLTDLTNQAICVGGSFTTANVTTGISNGVTVTYLWYNDNGTANPTTIAISGQTTATFTALPTAAGVYKYRVEATNTADASCKASKTVTLTINPKPDAGTDRTLACANAATNTLTTSTTLAPVTAGGTFTQIGTTPAVATIAGNVVSGMSVAGTYLFQYSVLGCLDTVAVTVQPCAGCVKPNAGSDITLTCSPTGSVPTTATLTPVTAGGTWAAQTGNPATATVTGNSVTGLSASGTYQFIYSLISGGQTCTDTVQVIVPVCVQPKGSLGDFVWKDTNNNGIQDETAPNGGGVAGVQIELYKNGTLFAKDTTDATGKYLFTHLDAGTYKIKVLSASIPAGCEISSVKDAPSDDAKDSDVDKTTGESGDYVINPTDPTKKDILTVDAALAVPCVKSKVTLTGAPVCSADVQTYSITFSVANKLGIVKVNKGTLTGSNPYTVTGIPSGASLRITDSLSALCKSDTLITGPNCSCNPPLPILLTPSMPACAGDTFPTIKATVVGLATVEWFTQATGGTVIFTGLNFKPSGTVPTAGAVFYAQARSTDPTCPTAISTGRVMATINARDCTKEVDLALKKSINTKIAQIGDVLTYTLKVWNESNTNATGVEVTDSIAATVEFQAGSFTASRGSAVISGNVIKWTIGNIAAAGVPAAGDTVTLTYQVKATQQGIHYNTAEISKTNEKDVDSTPSNGKETEDDIDRQCFTVPIKLCSGNKVEVTIPTRLTNVKWYRNGGSTPIATGNVVLLSEIGTYTFTADNGTCPTGGCCPVILESDTNCCPAEACVPFTVKKIKK